ncbi:MULTISPECIES: CheR family methyltransferase [unclassified Pseudodesulfovibrio]|uniref:CheR family methyltransferase n=2 Tax=unclassified Pseudodesulfovibrio TaxID=2661612 RepID=UPI000FEB8BB5|nr:MULTISPECIES: CheR family methyltransferase [unclassified Pseudodesulfovibrio]MCJ2165758.1 chemotaxis protein CheR [Pseudodesulfovibrio sp. S3-i]RWU02911.1 chemotaxis protein CheR [Pseudodesulfovibrio sp. S3]
MSSSLDIVRSEMGDAEFKRFSALIHSEFGIKMPPTKKVLLQSRFQKRLRALGMSSYKEYCDYVFSPEGHEAERMHLIDVVTTNTTHFFREPKHWDIMNNTVLPELWSRGIGRNGNLNLWSAGCSSGEEPYTLAMVLHEWSTSHQGFGFKIMATDISQKILAEAKRAVYSMEKVEDVPMQYKKKYMLKSKNQQLVKMDDVLRNKISFQRLNFMGDFRLPQKQDIIFCRNVVIYFDRATQEILFQKFCNNLQSGGYLFIGHSESLSGMPLPIKQVAPTVFQRN